ncbi:hypothetical protein SLH49_19925 [Cognatiyoonia sp. IB215446]|nr:hypothetical protein [Cognatiyoonia sp. IB215446]
MTKGNSNRTHQNKMSRIAELLVVSLNEREASKLIDLWTEPNLPICYVTESLIKLRLADAAPNREKVSVTALGMQVLTALRAQNEDMCGQRAA